jgi:two-component system cell cycle sensor histidine kinase/response regulator CckA
MNNTEPATLEDLERDTETPDTSPIRATVRILHWEEFAGDADLVRRALAAEGLACEISVVSDAGGVRRALEAVEFDVVVAGARPPALDPKTVIDVVSRSQPALPVIFFLSIRGEELAVEALHAGAADYVSKHRALDLAPAIVRAISRARARRFREDQDAAFRKSEEFYRSIVDNTTEWIWEIDTEGRQIFNNPAVESILGYTPEELQGKLCSDYVHPEDKALKILAQAVAERKAWSGLTMRWRHKDGTYRYLESNAVPILGADGQLAGYRGTDRDTSERTRLEGELQQARKMEAVGRLAGGVAHDFNNLLTTIIGFGFMLRESLPADDPRRDYVGEIAKASERAATLTRQLLAFSRQQVMENVALNVNDAVRGAIGMLRDLLGDRVQVSLQLASDVPRVRMDPAQLDQILIELVLNARDSMPDGGSLTIQTFDAGADGVALSISDTGHGMTPETLGRVFEPFFTTKADPHGRGLGLSTVYGIVKQSGGSIGVSSVLGQGSRFDLLLPKAADDVVAPPPVAPAEGRRGAETILVVEDEPPVRMLVRRTLLSRGYTVLEAGSAEDALAIAAEKQGPIDLMLTDSVLPGASGPALARELATTRPDMKVLFVSGYSADGVLQERGLTAGQAFLQKPFELEVLAGKVRELLDREVPVLTT